jgi:hypothetical protein
VRRKFDKVSNLLLLDNNVHHVGFELSHKRPSFFRVARESHLALLRAMVEALRGTANLAIVVPHNKKRNRVRTTKFQLGTQPWHQVQRVDVTGCRKAWRFSVPTPCPPPTFASEPHAKKPVKEMPDEILIGFYELLAMIQSDCFMVYMSGATAAKIKDEELRLLEWLHENVRNEFEHYIPKAYWIDTSDLLAASHLALRITQWLLRESRTIYGVSSAAHTRIARIIRSLDRLMPRP